MNIFLNISSTWILSHKLVEFWYDYIGPIEPTEPPTTTTTTTTTTTAEPEPYTNPSKPEKQILVGAYDLEKWSAAKIATVELEETHYEIFSRFEILQVSGILEDSVGDFVELVERFAKNQDKGDSAYTVELCEPTGEFALDREVMAFVYRADIFTLTTMMYEDYDQDFVRSPCYAVVEAPELAKPLILTGVHTYTGHAVAEINALDKVRDQIRFIFDAEGIVFLGNMLDRKFKIIQEI